MFLADERRVRDLYPLDRPVHRTFRPIEIEAFKRVLMAQALLILVEIASLGTCIWLGEIPAIALVTQ